MASCKRAPAAHARDGTLKKFERFLEFHGGDAARGWPESTARLKISPSRPPEPPVAVGFARLDLPNMARKPGFEIRPWPQTAVAPAARSRTGTLILRRPRFSRGPGRSLARRPDAVRLIRPGG